MPKNIRKAIALLLFFLLYPLLVHAGNKLRLPGAFMLPTSGSQKPIKAAITFDEHSIHIQCQEKIFRPLNAFTVLCKKSLTIPMNDVLILKLVGNDLVIHTTDRFFQKYRNFYNQILSNDISWWRGPRFDWSLIFIIPQSVQDKEIDTAIAETIKSFYPSKFISDDD